MVKKINKNQLEINFSNNEEGMTHSMGLNLNSPVNQSKVKQPKVKTIDDLSIIKRVPSTKLILQTCGAEKPYFRHDLNKWCYHQDLIESACHGLEETSSLKNFYPYLDLNELIAFAGKTFQARSDVSVKKTIQKIIPPMDVYDIFNTVYGDMKGMPWLNERKDIPQASQKQYDKLNPYAVNKIGLKDRLAKVDSASINQLKNELVADANEYVFEIGYEDAKRRLNFNTKNLRIMNYQGVYPNSKNNKNNKNFAGEIHRIIKNY